MLQVENSTEDTIVQRSSEETEHNTLTVEEEEDGEEDGGFIPCYKKMELKGESESDKDLIIYSLNESLQIHKEIVERIQNEKDDIEDQFEQEKILIKKECISIEEKRDDGKKEINKLESIYNTLLKELENKKLEYRRMETRFYSHIKSVNSIEQESIYPIIEQMMNEINNLCNSLEKYIKKDISIELISSLKWSNEETIEVIKKHFINELNNFNIISILTEKFIIDIIINNILKSSIHPGVMLNDSFETIHDWIEKRNTSWAFRLKQQITNFIVNQSNEQSNEIELKKQEIIKFLNNSLSILYHNFNIDELNNDISNIIELALKLNINIKLQQDKLDILNLQQSYQFNQNIMNSINTESDQIILVVTPAFVADGLFPFIIPAKVYCV